MPTYYCHSCAAQLGHLSPAYTSQPMGTTYQLGNFMKHTVPDRTLDIQSVCKSM